MVGGGTVFGGLIDEKSGNLGTGLPGFLFCVEVFKLDELVIVVEGERPLLMAFEELLRIGGLGLGGFIFWAISDNAALLKCLNWSFIVGGKSMDSKLSIPGS